MAMHLHYQKDNAKPVPATCRVRFHGLEVEVVKNCATSELGSVTVGPMSSDASVTSVSMVTGTLTAQMVAKAAAAIVLDH
jgi:hypothetical protein